MSENKVELIIGKTVLLHGKTWKVAGWWVSGLVELKNKVFPYNNSTRSYTDTAYAPVDSITDLNGKHFNFEYENA